MKPVQVGLLVAAGAIGGALWMKTTQRPAQPVAAQSEAPAPAPPATAPAPVANAPEVAAEPVKELPPPPVVREAPRPKRVARAQGTPAPVIPPAPVTVPTPAPDLVKETAAVPPPVAVPTEPEKVTPPPPPAPPPPARVTLNAGTLIPVRLIEGLTSERNMPGDAFTGTLDKPLVVDGFVIAERGARVEGRVVSSDRGGRVKGVAGLAVELTRLHTADGQTIAIQTDSFERHAEQSQKDDAVKVGAGAAIGAAIGAGVGGGAGAGGVLLTRGKPVALPSETRIDFRLNAPVTVVERRG